MIVIYKQGLYSFLKNYNHDGINALEELKKEYKAYKESGRHSDRFPRLFSNRNVVVDKNITVINTCMNWTATGNFRFWGGLDELLRNRVDMINDITEMDLVNPTNYNAVSELEEYI